ncbi:ATP-dependent RNA helicase DDX42 [Cladorrhinum samala]|uniref:ATP-dependent RNA helicase DDX42 n=1 Tax=Cladorrhinum samala TaxID=585594 RepID=A0AAV9HXV4_9PEZI|nr:ATP-dependent RNA helicase DDX42 [Cladorrhinum samala]
MAGFREYPFLLGFIVLFWFVRPTLAFGAGNIAGISNVEGQNWRHGDIEDALLKIMMARAVGGKRFDKLMVSRVYFGNWLRDYSQAIDVGTVKSVSAEAIRLLLCILGFITFGYGSREFEVTAERLGCYRPEDHIDNPKNYADNVDARQYHAALRGPVDESVELAIDPETGMKNYIANEDIGIENSASHCRRLFTRAIELGRSYGRSRNKAELYESLRLLGTGLHCLEDFFAHSNYTELALIEMGEEDVFPHVGRNTMLSIPGARREVYPIVTGTFGGVDFLHSVTGEVSDKLIQSEIEDLEGVLEQSQRTDTSILRELLDKIPDGLLGGDKKGKVDELQGNAQAAQMEQATISPRDTEEFTKQVQLAFRQIMPAIEFHDELLQNISEAIAKIPILPKIIEQLEEQLSLFVFSIVAPFIIPIIDQIKNELATGASEIIDSSKNEQHIVFEDDYSSDPTHSMLAKDHFTNILNEIAGRTASQVVSWAVPQLMEAIDDEGTDVDRVLTKIIYGVLHHPAQRNDGPAGASEGRRIIYDSVKNWWHEMDDGQRDEYRRKLSRDGVESGQNHKEGQHDCGHGCGGKLKVKKNYANAEPEGMEDKIAAAAADAIIGGVKSSFQNAAQGASQNPNFGGGSDSPFGGFLQGVAGALGGRFKNEETSRYQSQGQDDDGGYTRTTTEYGRSGDRYGQSEYSETQYGDGGNRSEYRRYEQRDNDEGRTEGYRYEERTETYQESYGGGGGGYRRQDEREESYGDYGRREEREESSGGYGRRYGEEEQQESYGGSYGGRRDEDEGRRDDNEDDGGFLGNLARRAGEAFEERRRERGW